MEKIENAVLSLVNIDSQEFLENARLPAGQGKSPQESIIEDFTTIIPFDDASKKQLINQMAQFKGTPEKAEFLGNLAKDVYKTREEQMGEDLARQVERFVMLQVCDNLWIDHLDAVENLRQGIGLRGYGQRDPLVEYKNEAFTMFEQLVGAIDDEVVHRIYKIQVQAAPPELHQHVHQNTNAPASEVSQARNNTEQNTKQRSSNQLESVQKSASINDTKKKLGRNDPCWC